MKLALPTPIQNIIGILNWKVGPEVFPKSAALLALSLIGFGVAVFLRQLMDYSALRAAASAAGSAAILGATAFLCAKLSGYGERLIQTLTAMAIGGAAVILITTFLRFFLVVAYTLDELPERNVSELANFLLFPLIIWNVYVFAALFRRSFRPSVPLAFAIAAPLVYILDFLVPAAFPGL